VNILYLAAVYHALAAEQDVLRPQVFMYDREPRLPRLKERTVAVLQEVPGLAQSNGAEMQRMT
jgi:hypothetical protein